MLVSGVCLATDATLRMLAILSDRFFWLNASLGLVNRRSRKRWHTTITARNSLGHRFSALETTLTAAILV